MESERDEILATLARYHRLRPMSPDKKIRETLGQLINETLERLRKIGEAESSGAAKSPPKRGLQTGI